MSWRAAKCNMWDFSWEAHKKNKKDDDTSDEVQQNQQEEENGAITIFRVKQRGMGFLYTPTWEKAPNGIECLLGKASDL